MSISRKFKQSVIQIIRHNQDGSYKTRADRRVSLLKTLDDLIAGGYQLEHVRYIKQRHIKYLVNRWLKEDELGSGRVKNKMSHVRWLMDKLGRANVVPSNDELNIPKRIYVSNTDRSCELTQENLDKIPDDYMQMSLKAQQLFGLRMEESLKVQPFVADQGDQFFVKGSWAKGGRQRYIPIVSDEQRQWLKDCKILVRFKNQSLIPPDTSYKSYYERFRKACVRGGINRRHGLRHNYAQTRYEELSGMPCRVKGGLLWKEMTEEQQMLDVMARLQVSESIGHSRINITNSYLGTNRK